MVLAFKYPNGWPSSLYFPLLLTNTWEEERRRQDLHKGSWTPNSLLKKAKQNAKDLNGTVAVFLNQDVLSQANYERVFSLAYTGG